MSVYAVMPSDVYLIAALIGGGREGALRFLWRSVAREDLHPEVAEMVDGVEMAWALREGERAEEGLGWWFGGGA